MSSLSLFGTLQSEQIFESHLSYFFLQTEKACSTFTTVKLMTCMVNEKKKKEEEFPLGDHGILCSSSYIIIISRLHFHTCSFRASWCINLIINQLNLHMLLQGFILSVHVERRDCWIYCTCELTLAFILSQEFMKRGHTGVVLLQDWRVMGGRFLNTYGTAYWCEETDFVAINTPWPLLAPFPTRQKGYI